MRPFLTCCIFSCRFCSLEITETFADKLIHFHLSLTRTDKASCSCFVFPLPLPTEGQKARAHRTLQSSFAHSRSNPPSQHIEGPTHSNTQCFHPENLRASSEICDDCIKPNPESEFPYVCSLTPHPNIPGPIAKALPATHEYPSPCHCFRCLTHSRSTLLHRSRDL